MESIHKRTPDESKLKRLTDELEDNAQMMEILNLATVDIWEQVIEYFRDNYGEETIQAKLANFEESWDIQYEKWGNDLIIALGEHTDDVNFVGHEGYLNKEVTQSLVKDIRKRRARLGVILASRGVS